jgi:malonate-semialdehyde dehydrogenase (acetylating)/methylmalonate-semialdehyde dehydrogenase
MSSLQQESTPSVIGHWIGGRPSRGTGERLAVHEPRSGAVVGEVACATGEEVEAAVRTARQAFPGWRDISLPRRQRVLFAFRELLLAHEDELAKIVSVEHGKTVDDARGEVARGVEVVEYACGIPELMKGSYSEQVSTGIDTYSIRQPVGVCVGITPFNFPIMVPLWMAPMAIACGNTFVLKPSERDPSASLRLAELFAEAGLPDGVFNVLQGDKRAVDALLAHPQVDAVSFVGSTPVARHIYGTAAAHGKRVQALGGAKNHLVVLPDADLDVAADAAVSAAFGSAGQRCMAVSVLVAVEDVADELVAAVTERTRALRVGDSLDPDTDMGPLITAEQRERVRGIVERAKAEGAVAVCGEDVALNGSPDGYFHPPVVFDGVPVESELYREEVFGPVLAVVRVRSLAEAIELVNANPYGNGVSLFTRDGAAARLFQREVSVGMIGVNVPIPVPLAFYSFGGWKGSLFGDRHIYGPESVDFYTRGKVVTTRWDTPASRVDLGFRRD